LAITAAQEGVWIGQQCDPGCTLYNACEFVELEGDLDLIVFEEALRRTVADYAGVRPKLTGPGEPAADFVVDGPSEHGLPGLVQLFGIESPGLTSALSLAEEVIGKLADG